MLLLIVNEQLRGVLKLASQEATVGGYGPPHSEVHNLIIAAINSRYSGYDFCNQHGFLPLRFGNSRASAWHIQDDVFLAVNHIHLGRFFALGRKGNVNAVSCALNDERLGAD